jgi:hypothetical protein
VIVECNCDVIMMGKCMCKIWTVLLRKKNICPMSCMSLICKQMTDDRWAALNSERLWLFDQSDPNVCVVKFVSYDSHSPQKFVFWLVYICKWTQLHAVK